ncbi:hypothetical protein [Candidatus Electronema sp. PJ]
MQKLSVKEREQLLDIPKLFWKMQNLLADIPGLFLDVPEEV